MAQYHFFSDAQGWTGLVWDAANGIVPGCLRSGADLGTATISGLSDAVVIGNPFSLRARVVAVEGDAIGGDVTVSISIKDALLVTLGYAERVYGAGSTIDYDSGWLVVNGTIDTNGTATQITVDISGPTDAPGYVYIDNVYYLETEPLGYEYTHHAGGIPGSILVI